MPLMIDLQLAVEDQQVPGKEKFMLWANSAAEACNCTKKELTVRVTGIEESAELNELYRKKIGPTNVLSFPFEDPPGIATEVLGDLLICAPVVQQEADQQDKSAEAHWAHMLVHGVLHLCGYNHLEAGEADEMEKLETLILTGLGYPPPYDTPMNIQ